MLCLSCSCLSAQQGDDVLVQRYSQAGAAALAEKRYPEAEKAYEKLRQLEPGTAEVHANLGLVYFEQKKFAQAVPVLRQALKLKPNLPNAEYFLAMSLSETGRYTEALPGLQNGFRRARDPGLKRLVGLHLERAYTGLRRDPEAVEVALQLTKLYPGDPEVLYHTGRLCGNFAYLAMQQLSQVAPQSAWRHQASGELFESQGQYDLAVREYRAVLALDPGRPGIHFRLGRVLLRSRRSDSQAAALHEFEQELQIDPSNASAAYELGELYRKSGQLEKARDFFEMALKHYPDFEEARVGLGRVLIALRRPELALPHLRQALSLSPDDEVGYYQLAEAYKSLGDSANRQKALAEFESLRSRRARQEERVAEPPSPREVTKQELDQEVGR